MRVRDMPAMFECSSKVAIKVVHPNFAIIYLDCVARFTACFKECNVKENEVKDVNAFHN